MPSKRFKEWVRYFEYMGKAAAAQAGPNQAANKPIEVLIIAPLAQLALEAKQGHIKTTFLDKIQDSRTEEEKMILLLEDEDIGPLVAKIAADIMTGVSKPTKKTTKKSIKALEAAKKSTAQDKEADSLVWIQKAVLAAPHDVTGAGSLTDCFGVRAAAFVRANKPKQALLDIDDAIRLGQFKDVELVNLINLKVECLRQLEQEDAADALEETMEKLQVDSKAGDSGEISSQVHDDLLTAALVKLTIDEDDIPDALIADNEQLHGASSAIRMNFEEGKGRMLMATSAIKRGEIFIQDKPYVSRLEPSLVEHYCTTCFKGLNERFIPCTDCEFTRYCSFDCQTVAWKEHHHAECGYEEVMKVLQGSQDSIRAFIMAGVDNVFDCNVNKITAKDWVKNKFGNDAKSYNSLFAHSRHMPIEAQFTITFSAAIGYLVYEKMGFISRSDERYKLLAGIFLNYSLRSRTNAWAIYADHTPGITKPQKIGSGIYCVLSLINHSCDPNSAQEYSGLEMNVHAKRDIAKGEEITMSYGPTTEMKNCIERRLYLKRGYNFDCNCAGCQKDLQNVSLNYEMPPKVPNGDPAAAPSDQQMPNQGYGQGQQMPPQGYGQGQGMFANPGNVQPPQQQYGQYQPGPFNPQGAQFGQYGHPGQGQFVPPMQYGQGQYGPQGQFGQEQYGPQGNQPLPHYGPPGTYNVPTNPANPQQYPYEARGGRGRNNSQKPSSRSHQQETKFGRGF